MVGGGLITLEKVNVVTYRHHATVHAPTEGFRLT
jgi:hypothetical protein